MFKLAVVTNILTPYRIPLFTALHEQVEEFSVLLKAEQEDNRLWEIEKPHFHTEVLPGIHIKPRGHEVALHFNYGVIRALRKLNPDVVLSGGFALANLWAFIYCQLYRKHYVNWTELTRQDGAESSLIRRWIRRLIIRRADGCIAESSVAREAFIYYGARPEKVRTCIFPFDVKRFHQSANQFRNSEEWIVLRRKFPGPVLLSIGQLIPQKGLIELFQIYREVLQVRSDVWLLIVGDGPARGQYEQYVREQGWDRVSFIGYVQSSELPRYLSLSDVFVFHTLKDSFGLVLGEAMAASLPVVSSIFAVATRDLVDDGVNGFSIDPKNAKSSAEAVLKIINMTPTQRLIMGQAGLAKVRHFDIQPSAKAIIQFIGSLGNHRHTKPASLSGSNTEKRKVASKD
ncbi:MAG: glycosyltransferase family 4 protein [Nitrospira sp.]|nr:glycosyltransferase family 4 protein [Nitrospira sp.]